jgi:hypothetical protein
MSERLRDFFSPDRLRGNWAEEAPAAAAAATGPSEEQLATAALYERLRTLATERFGADDATTQLIEVLGQRLAEGTPASELGELLRQIEDLADAASMPRRRR